MPTQKQWAVNIADITTHIPSPDASPLQRFTNPIVAFLMPLLPPDMVYECGPNPGDWAVSHRHIVYAEGEAWDGAAMLLTGDVGETRMAAILQLIRGPKYRLGPADLRIYHGSGKTWHRLNTSPTKTYIPPKEKTGEWDFDTDDTDGGE